MPRKVIKICTQDELNKIKTITADEEVVIENQLELRADLEVLGILRCNLKCIWPARIVVPANSSPSIEAWENSSIRGHRIESVKTTISLFGFAIAIIPAGLKIKIKAAKTCMIQKFNPIDSYFQRNGIDENSATYTLYKKVSHDFKTQENTKNETLWTIGSTVTHSAWNPDKQECGEGKFHSCSRPYFCDEFRSNTGDKYIAIEIKKKDLYEWKNPQYPYKIAFRKGRVLYECNKFGKEITCSTK
jgi:hypothetical protein